MALASFNVVLAGDNFPVSSIRASDFHFRHREMRESLRLPMAFQAEQEGVVLQVLPIRFEAAISQVDRVDLQAEGLIDLASTFLEYVGRRTVTAVGHNAQWSLNLSPEERAVWKAGLLHTDRVEGLLRSSQPVTAEVALFFNRGSESRARLAVKLNEPEGAMLDYNFNYDLSQGGRVEDAIAALPASLQIATELSESLPTALQPGGIQR